jgi:hypothetical protein
MADLISADDEGAVQPVAWRGTEAIDELGLGADPIESGPLLLLLDLFTPFPFALFDLSLPLLFLLLAPPDVTIGATLVGTAEEVEETGTPAAAANCSFLMLQTFTLGKGASTRFIPSVSLLEATRVSGVTSEVVGDGGGEVEESFAMEGLPELLVRLVVLAIGRFEFGNESGWVAVVAVVGVIGESNTGEGSDPSSISFAQLVTGLPTGGSTFWFFVTVVSSFVVLSFVIGWLEAVGDGVDGVEEVDDLFCLGELFVEVEAAGNLQLDESDAVVEETFACFLVEVEVEAGAGSLIEGVGIVKCAFRLALSA